MRSIRCSVSVEPRLRSAVNVNWTAPTRIELPSTSRVRQRLGRNLAQGRLLQDQLC